MENSPPTSTVAIVVILFPRSRGIGHTLSSLAAQTRPADLVVLLDDGTCQEAATWAAGMPHLPVHYLAEAPAALPIMLNKLVDEMGDYDHVGFLQSGDAYEPRRIESCLAAIEAEGATQRPPAIAVTGWTPVDAECVELPATDARAGWARRLWAPAEEGVTPAEWLGHGNFVGTVSNIFARRSHLAASPFAASEGSFIYAAALLSAVQGQLAVVRDPLLRWASARVDREPSLRTTGEMLAMATDLLARLGDKLATSPETRRNLAAFHRMAWNNLSGLREDLFQQLLLRLAASFPAETLEGAVAEMLRTRDAQTTPQHLKALLDSAESAPDLAAYAARNRRLQAEVEQLREDVERLGRIAAAAQDSGWVRFGAWLGERSARRMMEIDQENPGPADPPPTAAN